MQTITPTKQLSLAQLRAIANELYAAAFACIKKIKSLLKAKKSKSCLAGKREVKVSTTVYPLDYNKNNPMAGFNDAAMAWSFLEQEKVREHYETISYKNKCDGLRSMIADEIAMEQLYASGLEVLVRK